jgi:hypothetical protein
MQAAILYGSAWFIVAFVLGVLAGRFIAFGMGTLPRKRQTGDYIIYWGDKEVTPYKD